jgi:hypothetical protein
MLRIVNSLGAVRFLSSKRNARKYNRFVIGKWVVSFAQKVGSAATEPLAVWSGIKTRPPIDGAGAIVVIKMQSKSRFQLESLSRSLPRAVLYQRFVGLPLLSVTHVFGHL